MPAPMLSTIKHWLNRAKDYRDTFSTPGGQRVLHDLMRRNFIGRASNGTPEQMLYNEGRRQVVLMILEQLKFADDPQRFLKGMDDGRNDYADPAGSGYGNSGGSDPLDAGGR